MIKKMVSLLACTALLLAFGTAFAASRFDSLHINWVKYSLESVCTRRINGDPDGIEIGTSDMSQANQQAIIKYLTSHGYPKSSIRIYYEDRLEDRFGGLTEEQYWQEQRKIAQQYENIPLTGDDSLSVELFIGAMLFGAIGIVVINRRRMASR